MKSVPSIAFDYRPCRGLAVAIVILTLLAVLAIFLSGIYPTAKLLMVMVVAVHGFRALVRHLKPKFVRVARGEGGWLLVDHEGSDHPVGLINHVRRGFLLVLAFRQDGVGRHYLVLTPDNSDSELRRRLILILATDSNQPAVTTTY